ncbi:Uncharacterised protein [Legionella wadsworthii]|uniref:Uncharacterized protein n=1 Tax=Legionella wadsworthii TaxID=28088 RepID=A0A378LNR3_9GAMM|nr:Uncharacterised protein [Legionella wadsworthii]
MIRGIADSLKNKKSSLGHTPATINFNPPQLNFLI